MQFIHYLSIIGSTLVTIELFRLQQQKMRLLMLLYSFFMGYL
ncbi:hypothetical protein GYX25_10380 [Gilliamella sp. ESL0254]|nr:hypothetical protein [Gilliamella sp. ESL0254]